MIQRTDLRQPQSSAAAASSSARQDGPEIWGQWSGRRHYSLEVVQHPLRARMCGFGDKDRRPLAPAAVAKMIVRREDDSIVDVDEVDSSFFLVTVDLWSADGKHEMNLVLHPSATDRYVPSHLSSKSKRRGTNDSAPASRLSGNQTPGGRTTPTPSQYRPGDQVRLKHDCAHTSYVGQPYYGPQPPSDGVNYSQGAQYAQQQQPDTSSWSYTSQVDRSASFPPPVLPSIHSFGRSNSTASTDTWHSESEPTILPYRPWNPDASYTAPEHHVDPALRTPSSTTETRDQTGWSQSNTYNSSSSNPETEQSVYGHAPYHQGQHTPYAQYPQPAPGSPVPSHAAAVNSSTPRQPYYTRTLVGPLSANACRLLDEHRKPGIFFLFQDLSVRTEGSFRLRMRLMNVGAPPAPEIGAQRVHNDVSPVLAQTFTEQFTVFSAKRFPGVPDTTALSIAFGNQGQKLPLRNRHGSNKRRRRGDSESDDDSDGA
ncbi:Velvet complex subunit B [Psilocybe cubensis]|uniref:Velvet complex subunit B n=1 Tax=Psilocybe cubensis TaxID=181762 RepID=A0ACB8H3Q6_PSICU|nr:Velvet complex subunit B [Psilocybe cubensis]KAH9482528.1 Velvet complex subunit B [Psilocybe cubensis]